MTRVIFAFLILAAAGAAFADTASADNARSSMTYYGTATMDEDTIKIELRSTADGKPAEGTQIYKRGDRGFDNLLRHLGGMRPGETKEVRPWKD
jgi:hypothetical protein